MICPACHAKVHRGSNFCSNCGNPVQNTGSGPNLLVQYVHNKRTVSVKKYKDYMDEIHKVTEEMKDFESGEEGFFIAPLLVSRARLYFCIGNHEQAVRDIWAAWDECEVMAIETMPEKTIGKLEREGYDLPFDADVVRAYNKGLLKDEILESLLNDEEIEEDKDPERD